MNKKIVLTPPEAQAHFKVTNQTLIRWSKQGKIEYERTPGNHRRYIIYEDVADEIEEEKERLSPEDDQQKADEERLKTKRFDDWKKRYWESPKGKEAHKEITRKLAIVANALGMTYEEFIEEDRRGSK